MKLDSMKKLYVEQLKDLYSAEKQLIDALPKMARAASDRQLQNAFNGHLAQTRTHVERLEQIFSDLDYRPGGHRCKGMEGLIKEGEEMISDGDTEPEVRDAGLIAAAQRVEHYEIAGYGTVRTYANLLGRDQDARVLQQTLDEEGETNKQLTQLAETSINAQAV